MNPLFPELARFGSRITPLGPPEVASGGFSAATVHKLVCEGGTYALRRWPQGTQVQRLRGLHRLLRHVGDRGVPVSVPSADQNGETLFLRDGEWWQLEPWLPGKADFRDRPTDRRLTAAMTALAAFHDAAATFVPTPEDAEWFGGPTTGPAPAVGDRLAILQRLVDDELAILRRETALVSENEFVSLSRRALAAFVRLAPSLERELRFAATIDVPLVPSLRDVWHDHVLFTVDEVTGLIDPAACRRDTVATDLSRLLGSLIGGDKPRWGIAISSYADRRRLTDAEVALIPTLDRSGVLLSAMTWLRRRYLLAEPCETPAVVARLRDAVEHIERMAK